MTQSKVVTISDNKTCLDTDQSRYRRVLLRRLPIAMEKSEETASEMEKKCSNSALNLQRRLSARN